MNRNRPEITEERVEQIRCVIRDNPGWNRSQISRYICQLWCWQSPNGTLKDISCRDMLRELDRVGRIKLPAPLTTSRSRGTADIIKHIEHDTEPIIAELGELRPLRIENVIVGAELTKFKSYINQYHYLGFDRTIGENMKYMIYSRDGQPLSCLLFGSAAWSCQSRDVFIGWDKNQRARGLSNITNNSRFLLFSWVRVLHLASHILSLIAGRIAEDWRVKYGHAVYCLETFVEVGRFRGTSYRAANWIHAGRTTGRGRDGGHRHALLPIKDVYLYPLKKDFRKALTSADFR